MLTFLGVINLLLLVVFLILLFPLFFTDLPEEKIFRYSRIEVVLLAFLMMVTATIYFTIT